MLGCGNKAVVVDAARLERSNLDSGASVTRVVTSHEKNSSTLCKIEINKIYLPTCLLHSLAFARGVEIL
jgi:hypothetical protein